AAAASPGPASRAKRRPGNRRASSASLLDVVASADAASAEQVDDCQQDHRADQRHDEAHDRDAVVDRTGAEQRADQPATDQGADDADDDVEQDSLLAIALHDDACQPADDAADDQPDDDSHACLPVSGGTPVRSAGHAGSGIVTAMSAAARRTGRHLAAGERRPEPASWVPSS